tara:strand:- start:346 stop:510 length:165 start_codon:yes stop_codon:yes gene_type:complete
MKEKRIAKRGSFMTGYMGWILFGLFVIVLLVVTVLVLREKGISIIDYIKDMGLG